MSDLQPGHMDTKFTHDEMDAAFTVIQEFNAKEHQGHWKNQIDARLPLVTAVHYTADLIQDAIEYFTGTAATVGFDSLNEMVTVKAKGYYLGPCN